MQPPAIARIAALFAAVPLFVAACVAQAAEEPVLNLYSARHYQTDEALYENFTKTTEKIPLRQILRLDTHAFGADRSKLLRRLHREFPEHWTWIVNEAGDEVYVTQDNSVLRVRAGKNNTENVATNGLFLVAPSGCGVCGSTVGEYLFVADEVEGVILRIPLDEWPVQGALDEEGRQALLDRYTFISGLNRPRDLDIVGGLGGAYSPSAWSFCRPRWRLALLRQFG